MNQSSEHGISSGERKTKNKNMWWILILGIWGMLLLFYVIKMAITEAKEEAGDIERASGKNAS